MNITVGITSGIAAFKILTLIDLLKKDHDIDVILSSHASHMIDTAEIERSIGKPVYTDLFPKDFDYKTVLQKRTVDHIEIAKRTELFVVAPTTANLLGKLAHGIADDFLTTTLLATKAPVLLCPSMNTEMWFHPAVQANLKRVQEYGYSIMKPSSGALACGTEGIGRLPEPNQIYEKIQNMMRDRSSLKGKKIIVTAGGTIEPIDSARVITNKSTGKMGIAIAQECANRGAEVLLLRSASAIQSHYPFTQHRFETSDSLEKLLKQSINNYDIVIHAAAVSDFSVVSTPGKIDSASTVDLRLTPQKKIIDEIKKWNPSIKLIGFKAIHTISDQALQELKTKMKKNSADAVIINDISRTDIGFGSDDNEVLMLFPDGTIEKLNKASKQEIAQTIIHTLIQHEILH